MIVDESGDVLRRLVYLLIMSMVLTTLIVCVACFSLYRAVREKEESLAQQVECRKESASKCVAKGLTALVRS